MPEFAKQAKADLEALAKTDTAKVTRAIRLVDPDKPDGEWVTEEINNPKPEWKQKGFESLGKVHDVINTKVPVSSNIKPPQPVPISQAQTIAIPVGKSLTTWQKITGTIKKLWPGGK